MNSLITKNKVPPNLVLTALLSSGLTIVVSVIYITLSIVALVYRFKCNQTSVDAATYYWNAIYLVYIQNEGCGHVPPVNNLTQPYTIYIFLIITLCFSVLTLIASILLATAVKYKEMYQYTNIFVFAYISAWVGSLIVDITLATHFGLDYTELTKQLAGVISYNYAVDVIRQGSFILLAITLKGYATYGINMLLIVLLIKYACDYQDMSNEDEHPIHKLGALHAFNDSQERRNAWLRRDREPYHPPLRSQVNCGYQHDEEPNNSVRNDVTPITSNSFKRSDSWRRQQSQPSPQTQMLTGARPFSYLEEIRRTVNPQNTPNGEGGWRRDPWPPAPPVPAPDYSPQGQRRLKSALKPAYM